MDTGGRQLSLFGQAEQPSAGAAQLEREHAEGVRLAAGLPRQLRFGTSSWSFPGWQGLVWSRRFSSGWLAREGLSEYARHPLLRTVGIDRSYYAPVPPEDLQRYASQLPEGFPCCAKAPQSVTDVALRDGARALRSNPDFLNPRRLVDELVGPFLEHFAAHTGPFVLQLPPAPEGLRLAPAEFAQRLGRCLETLPREAEYAVELRDPAWLTPEYARVLGEQGAAHVPNYASRMPLPGEQTRIAPPGEAHFLLIRLLLSPRASYAQQREAFAPFDRVQAPDRRMRQQVGGLARDALARGQRVYVLVNNKAEGSAPLTIRALAELLASPD